MPFSVRQKQGSPTPRGPAGGEARPEHCPLAILACQGGIYTRNPGYALVLDFCDMSRFSFGAVLLVLLAHALTYGQAVEETGAGSIVFVIFTPDNLTIAADSRLTRLAGGHDDTECKISAFGSKFAFAMAGVVFTSGDGNPHSIARGIWQAKTRTNPSTTELISDVAEEWTDKMEKLYAQSGAIGGIRKRTGGESLATAYFAATDRTGQTILADVQINFDGQLFDKSGRIHITHDKRILRSDNWYSAGRHEIADEYIKGTSDRAKTFMVPFRTQLAALAPSERDAKMASKLVELSILLHPLKADLAPPVDVLQMKPGIGTHWVSIKPNCPKD